MTALVPQRESLFKIEEDLEALLDTADLVETPEQQAEIKTAIANALERAVSKRDQVAGWLAQQESTLDAIDNEITRLRALKERRQRAICNVEEYVTSIILAKGPDAKGRFGKLEGVTSRFSVRKNPPSVEIVDEVSERFSCFTLQFNAAEWLAFTDSLDCATFEALRAHVKEVSPAKVDIKRALEQGRHVDGAQLAPEKYRLIRE